VRKKEKMGILDDVSRDLTAAMKAQDAPRTSALRMAKAALKNREIDAKGAFDDAEAGRVLLALVKQREDSAAQFRKAGRPELADKEEAEVALLEKYLPQQVADDEIATAVDKAVQETGAATAKDMGRVMKAALAVLQGSGKAVDGKRVSEAVKKRLAG
jgi:uncharacterized protein YqeY